MLELARNGDRAGVMRLLGPRTRARLVADARLSSEQAGHRRVAPEELLAAGWTTPRWEVRDIRELDRSGDHATVELEGPRGQTQAIECVRERGWWKIELP